MMFSQIKVQSRAHEEMVDITALIKTSVSQSNVSSGIVIVYVPHTTAGVTINENTDPDVIHDILLGFDCVCPENKHFRHYEGNSAAHMKASVMGSSCIVIVSQSQMQLGTWQGIYFCEFDGPRSRTVSIQIIPDHGNNEAVE